MPDVPGVRDFQDPEIPHLRWEIGPYVPDPYFHTTRDAIAQLHPYLASLGIAEPEHEVSIYIYNDISPVVAPLRGMSVEEATRRTQSDPWEFFGSHEVRKDGTAFILFHLTGAFPEDKAHVYFLRVAPHELLHIYQYALSDYEGFSPTNWDIRAEVSWWLIEGGAEFLLNRAFAKGGIWTYEQRRAENARIAATVDSTLAEMETITGFQAPPNDDEYSLSEMAAELLAAESGEASLLAIWELLGPDTPWQEAFKTTFGMTVEEFYHIFEKHRADGFPKLDLPSIEPSFDDLPQVDRLALVALYNATGGANWANNSNWLSDEHIGKWQGVTVKSSGRVTELDLAQNGLNGQLPSELGRLTELRTLTLWANGLTGTIPPELGNLTKLEALSVGGNQLSGEIPSWLGNLSNLRELHLVSNQFSGTIPPWIGDLPLRGLYLGHNRLTGDIPAELANLSGLRSLYLAGNNLTGCIPSELRDAPENDFADANLPFCGQ